MANRSAVDTLAKLEPEMKRAAKRRLTPSEAREVVAAFRRGVTIARISEALECSGTAGVYTLVAQWALENCRCHETKEK